MFLAAVESIDKCELGDQDDGSRSEKFSGLQSRREPRESEDIFLKLIGCRRDRLQSRKEQREIDDIFLKFVGSRRDRLQSRREPREINDIFLVTMEKEKKLVSIRLQRETGDIFMKLI